LQPPKPTHNADADIQNQNIADDTNENLTPTACLTFTFIARSIQPTRSFKIHTHIQNATAHPDAHVR
jgi:hypothetical protein